VGAILDFVNVIASTNVRFFMMSNILPDIISQSYRLLKRTPRQSYTWGLFFAEVTPRNFIIQLELSSSIFLRGLPLMSDLQRPHVANAICEVLSNNSILGRDPRNEDAGVRECSSNGWLHADKSPDGKGTVYTFASPLHRWFVEWRLLDTLDTVPFECSSILELALRVIAGFSPSSLSNERKIGPACVQRPPEAQYQDEFYRSCYAYSKGLLRTFPEFGTKKGRVDFYIPFKKWGVELLRDGDRLQEHSSRFSDEGVYGTDLELSEYIILDCRKTRPKLTHSGTCINLLSINSTPFSSS
jgi:hypothetical protein